MINTLLGFYYIETLFKIYSSLSDLLFPKFIHHYQYQYQYQILILIPYNIVLSFYLFLRIFGGCTFHLHKEQNLELLLINICMVFLLLVFRRFFIIKICSYTVLCFYFCFYEFKIITISSFAVKIYTH